MPFPVFWSICHPCNYNAILVAILHTIYPYLSNNQSSFVRAYICRLPEPTRVPSWVQHVQTPEGAKQGTDGCFPPALLYSKTMIQIAFSKAILNKLSNRILNKLLKTTGKTTQQGSQGAPKIHSSGRRSAWD